VPQHLLVRPTGTCADDLQPGVLVFQECNHSTDDLLEAPLRKMALEVQPDASRRTAKRETR
jgi:hypothetical protein